MKELFDALYNEALYHDDTEKIKLLLQNPNFSETTLEDRSNFKNEVFLRACYKKAEKIVRYLIEEESVDVNYLNSHDTNALYFAAVPLIRDVRSPLTQQEILGFEVLEKKKVIIIQLLLQQNGIKINHGSNSPLLTSADMRCITEHHKQAMMMLVKAGVSVEQFSYYQTEESFLGEQDFEDEDLTQLKLDLLDLALSNQFKFYELAEFLIKEKDLDVNKKCFDLSKSNLGGMSRISRALSHSNIDSFNLLIKHGAIIDKSAIQLLMHRFKQISHAQSSGYEVISKHEKEFILEALDLNIQDCLGQTFLHVAVRENMLDVVRKLLELKANPNILDKDGCSPLTIAVMKNESEYVEYLLKFTANTELFSDVSKEDHSYETTLIIEKNKKIEKGEKIENIFSPFHTAIAQENWQIADLFIKYDEVLKDIPGSNLLHFAALYNCHKAAEALIEKGQDMTAVDSKGRTPLDLARERGHDDFVQAFANKNIKIDDHNEKIPLSPRSSPFSPKKDAERVLN